MAYDHLAIFLLMHVFTVATFHTRPPIVCELGKRNTTGLNSNTEYEAIAVPSCDKKSFPKMNCTMAPGKPQNLENIADDYEFGLKWQASDGAGGILSVLKGFVVYMEVLPFDRVNPIQKCLYIKITNIKASAQYIYGIFQFRCKYPQQSEITTSVRSYPRQDMCKGIIHTDEKTYNDFIPNIPETPTFAFQRTTTEIEINTSAHERNMIIATLLSCCLVAALVIAAFCVVKKRRKRDEKHDCDSVYRSRPASVVPENIENKDERHDCGSVNTTSVVPSKNGNEGGEVLYCDSVYRSRPNSAVPANVESKGDERHYCYSVYTSRSNSMVPANDGNKQNDTGISREEWNKFTMMQNFPELYESELYI